jgi:hypothetical protein
VIGWKEVPVAPGHVFYDRLNAVLNESEFEREVEDLCAPHYARGVGTHRSRPGATSAWRCANF